ncbi:MAG TPA: monovalent cation/H(+) antiporter subunit G [Polyangia bacterium]
MIVVAAILAGLAVALNLASAVGALAMRDSYQRLHFLAPPASIAPLFFAIALFFGVHDKQPALKMLVVAVVLNAVNGVVTHATARAHRVRDGRPYGSLTDEEAAAQEGR